MNPEELTAFLSEKGFSVKQVPLSNTLGKLGKDGVNTYDLTANFCDKFIGSKFWTCSRCAKMFDSQRSLTNHFRTEHYDSSILCKLNRGEKEFPIKNLNFEYGKKDETCYIIVKTDPDFDAYGYKKKRTRRIETSPRKPYEKKTITKFNQTKLSGPFNCSTCDDSFEDCCKFSLHMNSVHFRRRRLILRCQICEKKFPSKNGYIDTIGEQTISAPHFSCDICGKSFTLQAHLDYHRKMHHSKIKPYQCSLCSKCFSHVNGLSQHMKTHSGNRPFECNVCSKTFRQKAGLDQHMRIHNKTKPYNCLLCGRAFTQSAHLSQHMRIHTKIEPFECGLCNRRFKQSSHLNFHLRSHEIGNNEVVFEAMDSAVTITPINKSYQIVPQIQSENSSQ